MPELSVRGWRLFVMLPCALLFSLLNLTDPTIIEQFRRVTASRSIIYNEQPSASPTAIFPLQQGPVVDVISIGSLLKPAFQNAQERTFGQHPSIRNFYSITEKNDTDSTCFTDLTSDQLDRIIDFCAQTEHQSYISKTLRERLFEPKKHTGWMCAQKRPLDGLYQVIQRYVRGGEATIPDYLFIVDDSTYVNMNRIIPDLRQNFPVHQPHAVAGCKVDFLTKSGFTFPRGGFGTYLTKAAIARLIQPFFCDDRRYDDEHSNLACWRLNINALGEKQFFVDGMSVSDLMQAYAAQLRFTDVDQWNTTGYCLHADHALAYFINFYAIAVPDGTVDKHTQPTDKARRHYSFVGLPGEHECEHVRDQCSAGHRLCHSTKPQQMDQLYEAQNNSSFGMQGAVAVSRP